MSVKLLDTDKGGILHPRNNRALLIKTMTKILVVGRDEHQKCEAVFIAFPH